MLSCFLIPEIYLLYYVYLLLIFVCLQVLHFPVILSTIGNLINKTISLTIVKEKTLELYPRGYVILKNSYVKIPNMY